MAAIHDLIAQVADERLRRSVGGAEQFVRLEINRAETIQKLLLIDKPAQLDVLFDGVV